MCIRFILQMSFITLVSMDMFYQNKRQCELPAIANAKIRFRQNGRVAKIRCHPGYISFGGDRKLTCVGRVWIGRRPTCITKGCHQLNLKNGNILDPYEGAINHFECHLGYVLNGPSSLFCDGISWNGSIPTCTAPPPKADHTFCSFETYCDWLQDHDDDYNWVIVRNRSPVQRLITGEHGDHTHGTLSEGSFIAARYYASKRARKRLARVFSPVIASPEITPACVTFWFIINSPTGKLSVYEKPSGLLFETISVASEVYYYSNADGWRMAYIFLQDADIDYFQIVLEAQTFHTNDTGIAVDDFRVSSGEECLDLELKYMQSTKQRMVDGSTIPTTTVDSTREGTCLGRCGEEALTDGCGCNPQCGVQYPCCKDYAIQCPSSERQETTESTTLVQTTERQEETSNTKVYLPSLKTIPPLQKITTTSQIVIKKILTSSEAPSTSYYKKTEPTSVLTTSTLIQYPDKIYPNSFPEKITKPKVGSWPIPLLAVIGLLGVVVIGVVWWKRRKIRRHLPHLADDSDVRRLKEESKEEEEDVVHEDDGQKYTTSYRQLNNIYPQEEDGTPV